VNVQCPLVAPTVSALPAAHGANGHPLLPSPVAPPLPAAGSVNAQPPPLALVVCASLAADGANGHHSPPGPVASTSCWWYRCSGY
jgi:hypothetical protein